jgi:hypothetical protein
MSNFAINRLNNQNITDTGIQNQGQQLLRIVSINSSSPQQTIAGITDTLKNNDLAFMESGSLFSYKNGTAFYYSPFYLGTAPEKPGKVNIIGSNTLFSPTNRGVSTIAQGLQGTIYVSPYQGKYILQSTTDDNQNQVYNIYYNPINRSNVDATTINQNLSDYCKLVNFADPTCFCQNGSTICGNLITGGNYASLSAADQKSLGGNCAMLSPMCQKWAQYGNKFTTDEISISRKANPEGVPICGNKFSYADDSITSANGTGLLQSCGFQDKPTQPPGGSSFAPVPTDPNGSPAITPATTTTSPPDKKKMSMGVIIAIAIVIMIIVIALGLYL